MTPFFQQVSPNCQNLLLPAQLTVASVATARNTRKNGGGGRRQTGCSEHEITLQSHSWTSETPFATHKIIVTILRCWKNKAVYWGMKLDPSHFFTPTVSNDLSKLDFAFPTTYFDISTIFAQCSDLCVNNKLFHMPCRGQLFCQRRRPWVYSPCAFWNVCAQLLQCSWTARQK